MHVLKNILLRLPLPLCFCPVINHWLIFSIALYRSNPWQRHYILTFSIIFNEGCKLRSRRIIKYLNCIQDPHWDWPDPDPGLEQGPDPDPDLLHFSQGFPIKLTDPVLFSSAGPGSGQFQTLNVYTSRIPMN